MMTFEEYQAFQDRGFSHAPLIKKRLMDAQTPVSVFSKVRDLSGSAYLFESVAGGERWARYSMIGLGGDLIVQYIDGAMTVKKNDHIDVEMVDQPFEYIRTLMAEYQMPTSTDMPALPSFSGGLVGYFGYDMVRVIEPSMGECEAPNPMTMPDMWLMLSMNVIVFDRLENTLSIIVYADCRSDDGYSHAIRELEKIEDKLTEMPSLYAPIMPTPKFKSHTGMDKYSTDVNKIKDYIMTGDVQQVVPAQRLTADYKGNSLAVYRALRFLNPSPYLFLVHGYTLDDHKRFDIIGASPEMLSRVEDGRVSVRPLAGTRKRGQDAAADLALETAMLADQQAVAEHCKLVDLARDDLSRVCEDGSVEVRQKMAVERYSQVMQMASHVEGAITADKDALDVLCATFPAGSLSGAPKIRAMQILDEIEPVRRSVFGGCVGYLGWHGNMDTAIAVRTAVMRRGKIHIQVGASVNDSAIADAMWEETNQKAQILIKAVKMACNGLRIR